MSDYQDIHSLGENPVITEGQQRAKWVMIQVLAYGLMLGIMSRAAWDHGLITSFALALKDLGVAVWLMLRDSAAVCWDFFQYVFL